MSKLVECPNCLGTGEELYKGKFLKTCKVCNGIGMVDKVISDSFISSLNTYIEDDIV